jgi:hypothetical protein
MKRIWTCTLALGIGVGAHSAAASERDLFAGDRATPRSTTSAVVLGKPSGNPSPVVPASFQSGGPIVPVNGPLFRAQNAEPPQPMPSGIPVQTGKPTTGGNAAKGPPLTDVPAVRHGDAIATTPQGPVYGGAVLGGGGPVFNQDPWCGAGAPCGGEAIGIPGDSGANCFWFRADYLLWNMSPNHTPPLLTTSPVPSLGVIGQPGTQVLYGGTVDQEEFSGGRFAFGFWLDPCEKCAVDTNFFFLGNRSTGISAASTGIPLLARPFLNADPNNVGEDSELVATPAIGNLLPLIGAIDIHLESELWGADINWLCNLKRRCHSRFDFLLGFRLMRLRESLDINENLLVAPNSPLFAGQQIFVNDQFSARNWFYGVNLGLRKQWNWCNWQIDVTGKVGLGSTHQRVNIDGATIITPPGGLPSAFTGGLLAQPTNIGEYNRDRFSVVPEVGVNLGYQLSENWRLYAGYTFIYWSDVARPGQAIDRVVNTTQIAPRIGEFTGPARPQFTFTGADFWAYGVNFGFEFRY